MKNWKKNFRKQLYKYNRRGFTLIELLVVTAILGILIGISTTVFIGVLRSQNKTNVTSEVRQNAILAIDLFERDIRDAESVDTPASNPTDRVTINKQDGSSIIWDCYVPPSNNGEFRRSVDGGVTFEVITNNDPTSGVDIECLDDAPPTDPFLVSGTPKSTIVKLDFSAKQAVGAPTRSDFSVNLKFETTVGTRKF